MLAGTIEPIPCPGGARAAGGGCSMGNRRNELKPQKA